MTAGLYLVNDNYVTQLDNKYKNVCLVSKVSKSWTDTTFTDNHWELGVWEKVVYTTITYNNCNNPILFIRPIYGFSAAITHMSRNGSSITWTILIYPNTFFSEVAGPESNSFVDDPHYSFGYPGPFNNTAQMYSSNSYYNQLLQTPILFGYIFDTLPDTPSTSGMGLEIYNDQGKVVYNSNYPPLNIVGTNVGYYTSGRQYAFSQPHEILEDTMYAGYVETIEIDNSPDPPTFENVYRQYNVHGRSGWSIDNNKVYINRHSNFISGEFNTTTYSDANGNFNKYPSWMLIADVTNF